MPRRHSIPVNERMALSLPNAAAALDMSLNALTAFVEAGEIPLTRPVTPGGTEMKRILWRDLEAFAERQRDRPMIAGTRRTA